MQEHRHGEGVDAVLEGNGVVGFHTLVVGEVSREQAPERIRKGLAQRCTCLSCSKICRT